MTGRLSGKVAIVTGAAPVRPGLGIGKAISLLFSREGARVALVNRSPDHARELQAEIEAEGGECEAFAADVARQDDVRRVVQATVDRFGRLDILCNNVGIGARGTAVDVEDDVWEDAMNVNLRGTLWCCRHAIPRMVESGGGSIVNVSTLAAVRGMRRGETGFAAYAASKAGVLGLGLSIAADFAGQGIRVNNLLVGMVNTPALDKFGTQAREKRRLAVPLGTEGTAWDVAWAAVYLASDEARWITGASIPVDGGQSSLMEFPT